MKKVTLKDIFKYSALALFMSTTLTACGNDDDPIDTPIVEEDSTGDSSSDDSGSDDSSSDDSSSDDSSSDDSGSDDSGSDDSGETTEPVGDTTPPVITLNNDAYIKMRTTTNTSAFYTDPGATATDDVDGNLDGDIIVSGVESVDLLTPGTYQVTYNVSDAAGNEATEVVRTVRVENYGDKDTSFNSSGVIYTDVAADIGEKVLQDSSGNIFAIGTNEYNTVFVRKYTSAGAVDTTYGVDGSFSYVESGMSLETADAMIDDSDNLFVAVKNWGALDTIKIIKVKPDATLDSSFGTNGVAEAVVTNVIDLYAMSSDSQGNTFIVGILSNDDSNIAPFITKFSATGSLDTNFGTDGIYAMPVTVNSYVSDIVVTSNDYLALVGHTGNVDNDLEMKVWQVTASGTLDTDFGNNGVATYNDSTYSAVTLGKSITVDSEGSIIAAGEGVVSASQRDVIIMKLASDGSFDSEFSATTKLTNVNTDVVYTVRDVAVGDDGIIYIAGGAGTTAIENRQDRGYVVAFTATGTPAYHFGASSSLAQYDMIENKRDNFISLLLDETNNHILVLGSAYKDNTIEDTVFVLKLKN